MTPHVALLRGINVGGKNKLPMAALAELFSGAGCAGVQTYIQSGNVVFLAKRQDAKRITGLICQQIREQFDIETPIVVRTGQELERVATNNPFLGSGVDAKSLHVGFLADKPNARRVAGLDANRSAGDRFRVVGRDIYLHLPGGVAKTKLTNKYFDDALATVCTVRNWRTVLKLVEMTGAMRDGA